MNPGRVSHCSIGLAWAAFLLVGVAPGLGGGERRAGDWTTTDPAPNTLTFWGHAACYLDIEGTGIVTDPVFAARLGAIFPRLAPAPEPQAYDQARIVLVSHAHRDHLHPPTLATFPATATVLCPLPSVPHLTNISAKVVGMEPGDRFPFAGGTIVAVPAHHPGGRNSLTDRADGGALGYVILTPERTIYYTGDTRYFDGFQVVAARYEPDLVLMNLNAHLCAGDAVQAIHDLGAPPAVLLHHGAYATLNDLRWPRWRTDFAAAGTPCFQLGVGESRPLAALWAPRGIRVVAD
jgi:L-ascorbate metabolism protein UlaG (beta-lactamase superfamily)